MAGEPLTSSDRAAPRLQDDRTRDVRAAQIRLLYTNVPTSIAVTVTVAPTLAFCQWGVIRPRVVAGWLTYMLVTSGYRFAEARRYERAAPGPAEAGPWGTRFLLGTALAAFGWGAAGILLYPDAPVMNQVLLVFIVGGMMLGGASVLAPRSDAFLTFLLPTGLVPAARLLVSGDSPHVVMGLLAALFTGAVLVSTLRIHRTIASSLHLGLENQELVHELQEAKRYTDAVNAQLESHVEERTAELEEVAERLRAEISQREQAETELLQARKLESLGVLAGGIAHDFNNFLTVVQANLDLARLHVGPDGPLDEILGQTERACQRAVVLSTQLLTFAKGGAPIRRVTAIDRLVVEAVDLARAGASVTINLDVEDGLWCAEVDPGQIGQVLHNVLLNAKQASADGSSVDVRAENIPSGKDLPLGPEALVRITIRDHGSGIDAEILPLIFDPYFTTKGSGSGLGLATAYAIVTKHGGHLTARSKPGEGTTFIIDLPASAAREAPASTLSAFVRNGTGRLLVMDDEESIRTLLDRVLTKFGYEVRTARDGAEAIDLYEAARAAGQSFDLVLLDLTVTGGMGGVETAGRLKALDPAAKLIACSGYSNAPVMSHLRDYGFDDALPKPWAVSELGDVLRRVLRTGPQ